ncbi:hypothetical protein L1887_03367 [Cichorium endivia]|nr:hypothetical protein L1887_03367 [Cichorium endivia]
MATTYRLSASHLRTNLHDRSLPTPATPATATVGPTSISGSFLLLHLLHLSIDRTIIIASSSFPMATADNGRSLYESGGIGEKFRKRPFRSEINEEPQNVSHEAGQNLRGK